MRMSKLTFGVLILLSELLLQTAFAQERISSAPVPSAADTLAMQRLLLDGVRAFRTERYTEALEIFRRIDAEQAPKDIGFYLGMVLHKLGRHAEALLAFRAAHRSGLREPVADYYRAVSCYKLGLLFRARADFQAMLTAPLDSGQEDEPVLGPHLQQGAQRFLQAIEQALPVADVAPTAKSPAVRRYEAALQQTRSLLGEKAGEDEALEWLEEAIARFLQIPERQKLLLPLQKLFLRLRETVRGKPTELDVQALWERIGNGSPL